MHQCRCVVRGQNHQCVTWSVIGRYFAGKPRAKCWFRWQQSCELEAYSDAAWEATKATRRSVSAGVTMRGGYCLKVWTKKQHVVSLSTAQSELYARSPNRIRSIWDPERVREVGISCGHLDASAAMCLANRRGLGNAKTVDMQHLWIQEARKSGRFVTKVGTSVNPANLMTKPLARPKIEQLMHIMVYEFINDREGRVEGVDRRKHDVYSKTSQPMMSSRGYRRQLLTWRFFIANKNPSRKVRALLMSLRTSGRKLFRVTRLQYASSSRNLQIEDTRANVFPVGCPNIPFFCSIL